MAGALQAANRTYSTAFSANETPISEGGNWSSRSTSRTLVNTSGGVAFGTQSAHAPPPFDDSYAYVNGIWRADTEAIATVFKGTTAGIQEVELMFRVTDAPGSPNVTGYEMNIAHDGAYANCYAWQGDVTNVVLFRQIAASSISGGVANGYKFKGRCQGNVLSLWVDRLAGSGWQLVFSASDTAGAGGGAQFLTGSPAIGFYRDTASGAPGASDQYAFTDYTVTEI